MRNNVLTSCLLSKSKLIFSLNCLYFCCNSHQTDIDYWDDTLTEEIAALKAEGIPVWHGSVSRRITRGERQEPDAALREAVDAIIAQFPPGSVTR